MQESKLDSLLAGRWTDWGLPSTWRDVQEPCQGSAGTWFFPSTAELASKILRISVYLVKHFSNVFFRTQNSTAAHKVTEEVAPSWWVTCKAKAKVTAQAHLSILLMTWDLFIPGHFWPLLPFSFLSLNNLCVTPTMTSWLRGGEKPRQESYGESSCSGLMG